MIAVANIETPSAVNTVEKRIALATRFNQPIETVRIDLTQFLKEEPMGRPRKEDPQETERKAVKKLIEEQVNGTIFAAECTEGEIL
jgi:hypothetical protein